ncbi:MAG: ATP-binding protein [Polyangiaceae bacterium]
MTRNIGASSSIQRKIFAVICALTTCLVAFLATYFPQQEMRYVQHRLENRAVIYARLLSKQSEPAVAFNDRQTARELFDATAQDKDIHALALLSSSGQTIEVSGEPSSLEVPADLVEPRMEIFPDLIRLVTPVVSAEGPRGVLIVELGTETIELERTRVQRTALIAGFFALLAGLISAWAISRSIGKRLGAIAEATKAVAAGDLNHAQLTDHASDEIGQLARSFNAMSSNIGTLVEQISTAAANEKERLDALVRERTAQLDARNNDMRFVLDHVGQGFFTVEPNGSISRERSAIAETWLGAPPANATLAQWVDQVDPRVSTWMQIGWDALTADIMPMELSLDQLPKSLMRGSTSLAFAYSPIMVDGALSRVLVVISDVTSEIARERSEAAQREFQAVFERIVRDKSGFVEFVDEATELVSLIDTPHLRLTIALRRAIHTLKGNCAIFGLATIAEACHALEDSITETNLPPTGEQRTALAALWSAFTTKVQMLTTGDGPPKVETEKKYYDRLLDDIASGVSRRELLRDLLSWKLEPTSRRLTRFGEQARSLAARLGKPDLLVVIEHNDLRLSADGWAPFWSAFAHVLRNAVDHGIESQEERVALGKSENGALTLRSFRRGGAFIVEVEDDGRGIDWTAVAERAHALGLPASNAKELAEVIFADGLSTKQDVTESSGRGVGLGAARAECMALGGSVSIQTEQGVGTCFRFSFPESTMVDAGDRIIDESDDAPRSVAV